MAGFRPPPPPDPPLLYRHTAAGAVIAIVSIMAALTHGTLRYVLDWTLFALLLVAIGVFFHGHRLIGHLWREWRERRTGKRQSDLGSQWRCVLHPVNEKFLGIELIAPRSADPWTPYFNTEAKQFSISSAVIKGEAIIGTSTRGELRIGGSLGVVYPEHFEGEDLPVLKAGRYRFDWRSLKTDEVLASAEVLFDQEGYMVPTFSQRLLFRRYLVRDRWRELTKPL